MELATSPLTAILPGAAGVAENLIPEERTLGVRIPDHAVALAIVEALGHPLVTASVKDSEEEYTTDPSLIEERYGSAVEAVIDGGYGLCVPTTVVDCTDESNIVVLREGIGELV